MPYRAFPEPPPRVADGFYPFRTHQSYRGRDTGQAFPRAYCLAASLFLEPCQKRILARLSLEPTTDGDRGRVSYADAAAHLAKFPHLAVYVTNCSVLIPQSAATRASEKSVHAVISVLRRLKNVHDISIQRANWSYLPSELSAAVLGVIWKLGGRKQVLHRLASETGSTTVVRQRDSNPSLLGQRRVDR
ncbi:hypothetical protein C8F01DRAFT_1090722 [Mycena amicta]|nr:hypothetical protein C8F01DRAFT_1090722 [Mycena amicta]